MPPPHAERRTPAGLSNTTRSVLFAERWLFFVNGIGRARRPPLAGDERVVDQIVATSGGRMSRVGLRSAPTSTWSLALVARRAMKGEKASARRADLPRKEERGQCPKAGLGHATQSHAARSHATQSKCAELRGSSGHPTPKAQVSRRVRGVRTCANWIGGARRWRVVGRSASLNDEQPIRLRGTCGVCRGCRSSKTPRSTLAY